MNFQKGTIKISFYLFYLTQNQLLEIMNWFLYIFPPQERKLRSEVVIKKSLEQLKKSFDALDDLEDDD